MCVCVCIQKMDNFLYMHDVRSYCWGGEEERRGGRGGGREGRGGGGREREGGREGGGYVTSCMA